MTAQCWDALVESETVEDKLQTVQAGSMQLTLPLTYVNSLKVGDAVRLAICEDTTSPGPCRQPFLVMRGTAIAAGSWGQTVSCGGLLFRVPVSHPIGTPLLLSVAKIAKKREAPASSTRPVARRRHATA